MASLYIKNDQTAQRVTRLAHRLGLSKTATVDRALGELEANLGRVERNPDAPEWLLKFWREHPLPLPTGLKADKAFFDDLCGEP